MISEEEMRYRMQAEDRPIWYDPAINVYDRIADWADATRDRISNGLHKLLLKLNLTEPTIFDRR